MRTIDEKKSFVASAVISELISSDIYLTVKARLFDLQANLNGVRVTSAFLDEIVEHEDKYIGIPLCADVKGLLSNRSIGHMYDARTGEYHSTAIGSFYHFEKQIVGDNTYLIGYARVMKRNKAVCKAIGQLFAQNALKFSFEISCGAYTQLDDGTLQIDADARNFLEGAAIVTFPACEDAVALQLVAECLGKGDENMADVNENVISEKNDAVIAEDTAAEEVVAEEQDAEVVAEADHAEVAAEAEEQQAEEVVAENEQAETLNVEASEKTEVEQTEEKKEEDTEAEQTEEDAACDKEKKAECEENKDEKKQAENENGNDFAKIVAELSDVIAELRREIADMKNAMAEKAEEKTEIVAEVKAEAEAEDKIEVVAEEQKLQELPNPFMAEIKAPQRYSLLEREGKYEKSYSLLDRA